MRTTDPHSDARPLKKRLAAYGCTDFIRLDEKLSGPEQLDYLDLLPTRTTQTPSLTAVAEHQGTALLYLVDACGDTKNDAASLATIRRQLANRSDPAWLGLVRPGSLEIYPIGFHESACTIPIKIIEERSPNAPLFFQSLVYGTFEENKRLRGTDYVFNKIVNLLTQTTNEFVPNEGDGRLDALEILSMAGRALFLRFLIDRRIVLENEREEICPSASELKDAFSTAEKAAETSAWLDQTFNGDFLPLIDETICSADRSARQAEYLSFYERTQHLVGKRIFDHLQAILRGWHAVGGAFQPELDWGDLDFAHIPVGVLSQVYESFSHRADPRTARDTSVHYTPRTIAGLMIEQSFAAAKTPASARVLDPSCGAGIFLVLAFRRLVRERWQRDKERPKTAVIQDILYKQIRGFDVSESALRLAALSLYITAIEVNGTPRPPRALKFPRNLRSEVLHYYGTNDDARKSTAFSLGSLGSDVSPDFDNAFDIVIGNPPWTRLREEKDDDDKIAQESSIKTATSELNNEFSAIGRRVLTARGFPELAEHYQNPDKNPDLPFLWRATEWANDNGVIALAMPARLFGRTTGNGFEAWRAILRSIAVTGLINGADLRWSSVWKDVKVPFCIFFARNARPEPDHRFHYATPLSEPELNADGRFRIDYETAQPISATRVEKQPWLLKTLALGTWCDVAVMEALKSPSFTTLSDYWTLWDAKGEKTGQGYNRSPDSKQKYVDFLSSLRVFQPPTEGFSVEGSALQRYGDLFGTNSNGQSSAHMPRRNDLYRSPLVIIPQSPGEDDRAPRAYLSEEPLAFSQSYYGYSCAGHPEAETLAAFIYLLPNSRLFSYFCLMTSRRSGFDRQTFNKEEFDALPFPDFAKLSDGIKAEIREFARRLQHDDVKPWQELDSFIFQLYGLDNDAVQVAKDTLFSAASYRKAGHAAFDRTIRNTRAHFVRTLCEELEPYFDVCGEHAVVREADFQPDTWREPWFFLAVSRESDAVPVNAALMLKAMDVANRRGAGRIIVHTSGKRGLLVGLLNQRRWWTVTRARLCAQHIIRQHLGAFGLLESA